MNNTAQIPPGMLLRLINNKQDTIVYYSQLQAMTADPQLTGIIRDILIDENMHLNLFRDLYVKLFGEQPEFYNAKAVQIKSFTDGVETAVMNELRTYDFYGNIYFTDQNTDVQDTFLRALFDENAHSTKFNFIYNKLIDNRFA